MTLGKGGQLNNISMLIPTNLRPMFDVARKLNSSCTSEPLLHLFLLCHSDTLVIEMTHSRGRHNSRQKLRATYSFQVEMAGTVLLQMSSKKDGKRERTGESTLHVLNKTPSKKYIAGADVICCDVWERVVHFVAQSECAGVHFSIRTKKNNGRERKWLGSSDVILGISLQYLHNS